MLQGVVVAALLGAVMVVIAGLVPGSRFVEIPAGDHGLTAFADILAREIRRAVARGSDILDKPLES